MADLLQRVLAMIATSELADLGPQCRPGRRSVKEIERDVRSAFESSRVSESNRELVRSAILLWHDHLDAAHSIAQSIETADGSWVHGIMHRREPDFGNAAYWFRRVGQPSAFSKVTGKVQTLLARGQEPLSRQLLPRGRWDPFAFIQACEEAAAHPTPHDHVELLKRIQRAEFETLLEHLCGV